MELTVLDLRGASALVDRVAVARAALEGSPGWVAQGGAARPAIWLWDLGSDRVEWDDRLEGLFGYTETVTDAAWREERIHPADHERVVSSLQRAAIVNDGSVWSDQYRFRRADGRHAMVTERAYVVRDAAGPRAVMGAIAPTAGLALTMRSQPPQRARRPRTST